MIRLTIGVTGHRDIAPDEQQRVRLEILAFFDALKQRFPGLELEVMTALAEGADTMAAELAIEKGIPFVAVLPMPLNDYLTDFDSEAAEEKARALLDGAERTIELPVRPGADLSQQEDRSWQYAQLGVFISNHCQILLAIWDGKENNSLGGTASVMRYHLTSVMPGYDEEIPSASLLADNENDLAFHIVTGRDRPDGAPAEGLTKGVDLWVTSHFKQWEGDEFPVRYGRMLDRLSDFNKDSKRYSRRIEQEGFELLNETPSAEPPPGASHIDSLFRASDWLALHFQKRVNVSLFLMYSLAVVMGLVFIVYSERSGPHWLLAVFLALFFSGFALHLVSSSRQWFRKYLDYRALAEALRVQLYWNVGSVVDPDSPEFAYDTFLHKQDVELGWIRHVMRAASTRRKRGVSPGPDWLGWAIEQWIGDEPSGTGQLGYYAKKSRYNELTHRRTSRLGAVCLWTGIVMAFLLLVVANSLSEGQRELAMIFMGVLPLIAGVREAMSNKRAEKELIKQYRFMQRIFTNAQEFVSAGNDPVFQRRVLKALGEAALSEGAEWILMHRERPIEHGGL